MREWSRETKGFCGTALRLLPPLGERDALRAGAAAEGSPDGSCEAGRLVQGQRLVPKATNRVSDAALIREFGEYAASGWRDLSLEAQQDHRGPVRKPNCHLPGLRCVFGLECIEQLSVVLEGPEEATASGLAELVRPRP